MYIILYLIQVCQLVQVISLYCSLVTHNLLYLLHHPVHGEYDLLVQQVLSAQPV